MKIKYLTYARRAAAGIGIAGLGTAGAVMLMAAGTGTALAGTAGTCVASTVAPSDTTCQTAVSVSISTSTTIADNTPSITAAAPASLPAAISMPTVSLTVTSNDSSGWTASAAPSGDLVSGANSIPVSCLYVLGNVDGGSPQDFGGGAPGNLSPGNSNMCGTDPEPTTPVETDSSSTLTTGTVLTDNFDLMVPNVPGGTYATTLTYSISGN